MIPAVSFEHLTTLTTADGLYEHAKFTAPRTEHGYCVDDVARALVVTARQQSPTVAVSELSRLYLNFTCAALEADGQAHNRRGAGGRWTDPATTDDHWGRALWGLGTAAARCTDERLRQRALHGAHIGLRARSHHPRAMAYAAIGAAELLSADPDDESAMSLLHAALDVIPRPRTDPSWPWIQPRLGYANAVFPEALLVIGAARGDMVLQREALDLLRWLVELQTGHGYLSLVPTAGWAPAEEWPGFDQQPIEATTLAEACFRAWALTGDEYWAEVLELCAAWFLGKNDAGVPMCDPRTGGGYDGLHAGSVNLNQGAESTLAVIATFQLARVVALAPVR